MEFLLDTHTVLWWLADDRRLTGDARSAIADVSNDVIVSAVSHWELSIKRSIGTLDTEEDLGASIARAGFRELPIRADHAWLAGSLPPIHRDPFDRLLVAQAVIDGLTIVTGDRIIPTYGVSVLAT